MNKKSLYSGFFMIFVLMLTGLACSSGPLAAIFASPTPTLTSTSTPTSTPSPTPLPTGTSKEELPVQENLNALKSMDEKTFRAFVFDGQREHIRGDQITNVNITVPQDSLFRAMPPAFIVGVLAEGLPKQISGYKVVKDGFDTNKNGVEMGKMII